jgi:hypothetical protein
MNASAENPNVRAHHSGSPELTVPENVVDQKPEGFGKPKRKCECESEF